MAAQPVAPAGGWIGFRALNGDDADADARGRAAAGALRTLIDVDDNELSGSAAMLLARAVTDRQQLDQIDNQLAQIVATAATGRAGPAAFRRVPYRRVRSEWHLPSLRRARDNGARARRRAA